MKQTRFVQKVVPIFGMVQCIYIYGGSLGTCVHEYGFRRNDDVLPLKAGRLKLNGPSRIYENTIFSDSGSTT